MLLAALGGLLATGCESPARDGPAPARLTDPHTFSRPDLVRVEHLALDLEVDFEHRTLRGSATLSVNNRAGVKELVLDTSELVIHHVTLDDERRETPFSVGPSRPYLGSPLAVQIGPRTRRVRIDYETGREAYALQWFEPRQTAGGTHPFLLTEAEAIHARSFIPCQDTPAARATYSAKVRVPPGFLALMSAENPTATSADGVYAFEMPDPIPSYLIALAVGRLEFRPLGPRTGVYAEPSVIDAAAAEFAQTENLLAAAEQLLGPYRWGRYDLLVLPRGFPFGGMENPRLTFVTPTLLAGDGSLVSTIAHEICHAWSGNLVAAASWNDVWLNEGLTNYLERRVDEALYGRDRAETLAVVEGEPLHAELARLGEHPDSHLRLDLEGRDPDDAFGDVAYEKGYLFFRMLEEQLGRESWDRFLRDYFERFAFGALTTDAFLAHLREQAVDSRPDATELRERLELAAWVDGPGLPTNRPEPRSEGLSAVEHELARWLSGTPFERLDAAGWTTQHRVHFLRRLPPELSEPRLAELDRALGLSRQTNAILLQEWLIQSIRRSYAPADEALEHFLVGTGRTWLIEPPYKELAKTPQGLARAREIYARARPGYHPITRAALDELLVEAPPPS